MTTTGDRPVIAVFTIPDQTHFKLTLNLAAGLVAAGADVRVLAHPSQAREIEAAGAAFIDLFGRFPVDAADDASRPLPSRYVTHAAHWADEVVALVQELGAALVVQELFSISGRVAATALGLPRVAFKTPHYPYPAQAAARVAQEARVATDPRCLAAVNLLRERYGIADASPFSYLTGTSDLLNVVAEPPEYLTAEEQEHLAPLEFYGSLPYGLAAPSAALPAPRRRRIVVSFGTIIWRYYTAEAIAALETIADAVAVRNDVEALITLGGAPLAEADIARVRRQNVRVEAWIDQPRELALADGLVTHNGVSSTHEAAYYGLPMLSVPFSDDQPFLADRCRELGIAEPLSTVPRSPLDPSRVAAGLDWLLGDDPAQAEALKRAQAWEARTLADRPAVCRRIVALAAG